MTRNALTEVLSIEPETKPPLSERPTIWKRLVVASQTDEAITGCSIQVLSIERLAAVTDSVGAPLSGFEPGWLSWVPGQFQPIRLEPGKAEILDLVGGQLTAMESPSLTCMLHRARIVALLVQRIQ